MVGIRSKIRMMSDFLDDCIETAINSRSCSECLEPNELGNNYCIECGHKLKKIRNPKQNKNYCQVCGKRIDLDSKFCNSCGSRIIRDEKQKVCPICGRWMSDTYCWNCGHDSFHNSNLLIDKNSSVGYISRVNKCPNCFKKYPHFFNYCEECGHELIKKDDTLKKLDKYYM